MRDFLARLGILRKIAQNYYRHKVELLPPDNKWECPDKDLSDIVQDSTSGSVQGLGNWYTYII